MTDAAIHNQIQLSQSVLPDEICHIRRTSIFMFAVFVLANKFIASSDNVSR
jgi:hypothetical protein